MQVEQGQLRRFTVSDGYFPVGSCQRWKREDIFLVLEVLQPRSAHPKEVTFLVGDRIEESWGFPWIMRNSEAIDEAG